MTFFVLFLVVGFGEIQIQSSDVVFELEDDSNVQFDGSITLVNQYSAHHYRADGVLIRRFQGKGDGPGEFRYLSGVTWDGTHYFLKDAARNDVSVYDHNGVFLVRTQLMMRDLYFLNHRLIGLDLDPFLNYEKSAAPLVELSLSDKVELVKTERRFHFIHQVVFDWSVDQKQYFLDDHDGKFFVITELSKELCIYNSDYEKVACFDLELSGYVPPGEPWKRGLGRKAYLEKLNSFSQLSGLVVGDNEIAVSYSIPDENQTKTPKPYVQIVDFKGKAVGEPRQIEGVFLGGLDSRYYVIQADDDLKYSLKIVSF